MEQRSTTITPAEVVVGSGAGSGRMVQQHELEPLMLARDISSMMEEQKMKVMVALDDSDASFYALIWALTNLLKPKSIAPTTTTPIYDEVGCMVYLVHVQHPFTNNVYPAGGDLHTASFAASSVVESVRKAQAEISATILERAMSICKKNMVRAETLIIEGDPKDEICKAIEQTHVDMLVIGSRGLGGIKRAFLGSVSDYCAHHACCPVLIVKPPKNIN